MQRENCSNKKCFQSHENSTISCNHLCFYRCFFYCHQIIIGSNSILFSIDLKLRRQFHLLLREINSRLFYTRTHGIISLQIYTPPASSVSITVSVIRLPTSTINTIGNELPVFFIPLSWHTFRFSSHSYGHLYTPLRQCLNSFPLATFSLYHSLLPSWVLPLNLKEHRIP